MHLSDSSPESGKIGRAEWGGIALLGIVVAWLLRISWRRWPDALVDFGRELYLPWRLSQGAVLYRDLDAAFGPFSQYLNALIFRVTGVGCMHLVWANFLIYLAILALIFHGVRMGWGRLAAFAGSLVFITVFSFNQLVRIGNYNFLSPYSHETTHGFLLILILIHLWSSWLRAPHCWKVRSAGLCFGLCVLLKVEVLFVAVIVTAGAFVMAYLERDNLRGMKGWIPLVSAFLPMACLPSLIATLFLWRVGGFSFIQAFSWANIAWTGLLVYWTLISDPIQIRFIGLEDIPGNLATLVIYGGASVAVIAGLAVVCRKIQSPKGAWLRGLVFLAASGLASYWLPWMGWGCTFPAWLCLALFIALRERLPVGSRAAASAAHGAHVRWLFLLAAGALLGRMFLNPRIYHYGYFQAALAGVVIVATGFRSLPDLLNLRNGNRSLYLASLGIFMTAGLWQLEERSRQIYSSKTQPVGEGADQIFGFASEVNPAAELLESARTALSARSDCGSLVVIPEGVMLNYLLRKPVTISAYRFSSEWLNWSHRIMDDLRKAPPDYVVMISRDLREYGMQRFGDSPEHGAQILAWIRSNYRETWKVGGDPLDMDQRGVMILKKLNAPPAQ